MPQADRMQFKEIYAQAVEQGMSILGEGTSLVTSYLERRYSITLADTSDNPKILSEALDAAIDGGARVVQRRILRLLYESMGIKQPPNIMSASFEEKVSQARKAYGAIK